MIFILEDDASIRELVAYTLSTTGFETKSFENPSDFWNALEKTMPDLILLDIMLPQEDGFTILKKLRKDPATCKLPIIMMTAKGSEYDRVMGLENGADDYIAKPFGLMELLARVKALLRRTKTVGAKEYVVNDLVVNPIKHTVFVSGNPVTLTYKEFELLCYLLENKNAVLTRDQLLTHIWGYDFDGESRTLDVHIRTLRQKLGECGNLIETVRGVGYKI